MEKIICENFYAFDLDHAFLDIGIKVQKERDKREIDKLDCIKNYKICL